jgi:hypothetical protein
LSPKQQSTHLEKLRVKAELAKAMAAAVEATGSISCDKRGALAAAFSPHPSPILMHSTLFNQYVAGGRKVMNNWNIQPHEYYYPRKF